MSDIVKLAVSQTRSGGFGLQTPLKTQLWGVEINPPSPWLEFGLIDSIFNADYKNVSQSNPFWWVWPTDAPEKRPFGALKLTHRADD